jgi:hypothetical protein
MLAVQSLSEDMWAPSLLALPPPSALIFPKNGIGLAMWVQQWVPKKDEKPIAKYTQSRKRTFSSVGWD